MSDGGVKRTPGLKRRRRTQVIAFGAGALALAAVLAGFAFNDNIVFFVPPTELLEKAEAGEIEPGRRLRVGGLVEEGTYEKGSDEAISFRVTDNQTSLPVSYVGVVPDLFREGQGVVAEGYFIQGRFQAERILAKHDEKYMPREVTDALKKDGQWKPE
ncbi:MAG: cytochrome c maturation protein CcmE [Pseudomonadota bacterium]